MPELPEVETIRRQLAPLTVGRTVLGADSHPSTKFTPARLMIGATFTGVGRRGKYLLFSTNDDRELVAHLGMTGSFRFTGSDRAPTGAHLRAWWQLGPGQERDDGVDVLRFDDIRRFGRLRVVTAGDYSDIPTLAGAGPEPFDPDFNAEQFWERLAVGKRRIKTKLLSQRPIAGVGNIYADEALWLAGINPNVSRLGRQRAADLLDALRIVLDQGLANGGTTLRDYRNIDGGSGENQKQLNVYGRGGQACPRCHHVLRSAAIDGRTTTWCPTCQRH